MTKTLEQSIAAGRRLWIDFDAYVAKLFDAPVPWLNQVDFAAYYGKAQGLLRSDVIALSAESVAAALLASDAELQQALAAKSRNVYPLRRLLEEPRLRTAIASLLIVLRAAHGERPLALTIPSPRRWLALAYQAAHGLALDTEIAGDADEIDGASVYVADFLRSFATSQIDILLLCESPGQAPADEEQLACYQSVVNIARHYRWQLGLLDQAALVAPFRGDSLDFCIAPSLAASALGGVIPEAEFWQGSPAPGLANGQFHYLNVPALLQPEFVLERLVALRASAAAK